MHYLKLNIAVLVILVISFNSAYGQELALDNAVIVSNSTQALNTLGTVAQVATKVTEPIANEVESLSDKAVLTTGGIVTLAAGLVTKFITDRRGNKQSAEYASTTDQIVFNNVMDDYNDIAVWASYEIEELNMIYKEENKAKPYLEILNTEIDTVTHETIGLRKIKLFKNIVEWNKEYYRTQSTNPNIICPDPNNAIAKTMTNIKRHSTP